MNQRKCRMFSVLNEEQPASWPHLPLRPLLAVRLAWDVSIKIAERNCLETLPYINRSVLKKRAACIGTVQNEGDWAQPNKHFAKQKWRLYRQTPCLQKVDLKITERENRRVDFVRGWDYTVIEYSLAFTSLIDGEITYGIFINQSGGWKMEAFHKKN